MKRNDIDAMFLGTKAENENFFKEQISFLINEHINWRKLHLPEDKPFITDDKKETVIFKETQERIRKVLNELSEKMKNNSDPCFSPHYLGHMLSDILLPASLAYIAAIMYNPNNCSYEASPASSVFEIEAGLQLAKMMGYNSENSWGHITSGGTVANYEALWLARNLKSIPLAVKKIAPELLNTNDEWGLLNMPVAEIIDLITILKKKDLLNSTLKHSVRDKGVNNKLGKILVPKSRHYSWDKAADILGMGREQLIRIPVDTNYRMNVAELEKVILDLTDKKEAILCLVSVIGTTEESAVDPIDKIVTLCRKLQKKNINFYHHIDAAYGGYARALFLDNKNKFINYQKLSAIFAEEIDEMVSYACPKLSVYNAFKSIPKADSVTVDSHKLGYVPYPAGAIVLKNKNILSLLDYKAAYVDSDTDKVELGPYIMEGSKPGAAACAVWAAHKALPLNITGYGKLIARTLEAGKALYSKLENMLPFAAVDGNKYIATPLLNPDLNIVIFVFNRIGNLSLKNMNELNKKIYRKCSVATGSLYRKKFITSKTKLTYDVYGNIPKDFLRKLNIPQKEFDIEKEVFVLRATVMTPYFSDRNSFLNYWEHFIKDMKSIVSI